MSFRDFRRIFLGEVEIVSALRGDVGVFEAGAADAAAPALFEAAGWSVATGSAPGTITITVTALPADNGAQITGVVYRIGSGGEKVLGAGVGVHTLTGLTPGAEMAVQLAAVNAEGRGVWGDTKTVFAGAAVVTTALSLVFTPSAPRVGDTVTVTGIATGGTVTDFSAISAVIGAQTQVLSGTGLVRSFVASASGELVVQATAQIGGQMRNGTLSVPVLAPLVPVLSVYYDAAAPSSSDLMLTANTAGAIYWVVGTAATATVAQVLTPAGVVASGHVAIGAGMLGIDLPALDGVTQLFFHAVLVADGVNSTVASVRVQLAYVSPSEGVLHQWDFTNGDVATTVSVARTDAVGSTTTRLDNVYARVYAAANTARIDYEGVRGLLLEPSRVNYSRFSQSSRVSYDTGTFVDSTDAPMLAGSTLRVWTPTTLAQAVGYQAGAASLPQGTITFTASVLVKAVSGSGVVRLLINNSRSGTIKAGSATTAYANYDLNTGKVVAGSEAGAGVVVGSAAITAVHGGWYRVSIGGTKTVDSVNAATDSNTAVVIAVGTVGDAILTDEYQLEGGVAVSSHIVNAGTTTGRIRGGEVLTLGDVLGTVDLRLVTTRGNVKLSSQALNGTWSYTPTEPMKILRIEAHTAGTL